MAEILQIVLKISLVLFMAGNLLGMGLGLNLREAMGALRDVRFMVLSLLWGFVLCPALAYLLTAVVPLERPYAIGLLLLGMTPCAPFLPMLVEKARGDMGYAAAVMLSTSVVTIVYMPFAVPIIVKGLTADAWTIAKPLLSLLLAPLAVGLAIQRVSAHVAFKLIPVVKVTSLIVTVVMLVLCIVIYYKGFIGAIGSYAIGTQILFFSVVVFASYGLGLGLPPGQKSVLVLGVCTRNLGAAFAPLVAISDLDQRSIVMVALAVPMSVIVSLLAATWFSRRALAVKQPSEFQKQLEGSRR